ncbi:alpha-1,3-rhamnosyltransferase [Chryseobacterium soldanellicola]|uniref:Alpha-1,3-rhamnosyltransferase n=1 Tax=Chryseobacterium soldanellicola TaxID=311333 RepID=A0A1H1A6X6_9FLAO|nr:glycosyltransferase [Chryseobacterium soldanellicola]SDQ35369.1 alpha-1,3-rhamnosyltransferase [Chryseobacterium soldanellicola]
MENPLVSIIVVSYNHSEFITECLDSIKKQTYKSWELIVADDASKDNSADVTKNWLKNNQISAKTNFHSVNKGFATTLNECIEMTEGKYVNIIAADDYFHPEFLSKCVTSIEKKDESFGMVFSSAFIIKEDKTLINYQNNFDFYQNADHFRNTLKKANYIPALATLMNRKVLLETGPYDKNILIEDYDRWLRINENYFIDFVPENLAYHRKHEENISKLKERIVFVEEILLRLKYDTSLENKQKINNDVKKIYTTSASKEEIKKVSEKYTGYKGKERWLDFCLKYSLPVKLYYLKYKFF